MSPQRGVCPGCGAKVHPKAPECPECGRELVPAGRSRLLPILVGALGVVLAVLAGAAVWILLSPPSAPLAPSAPSPQQQAAVSPAEQAPPSPPAEPPSPAVPGTELHPATQAPFPSAVLGPDGVPLLPSDPVAQGPGFAPPPDMPLDLPKPEPGAAPQASEESRRAFARTTQESFVQNGLDLAVTTTGPEETVIQIKFNFPARTAVELIVSGPFPRQCQTRGFQSIQFVDPSGATWNYDLATETLSQR